VTKSTLVGTSSLSSLYQRLAETFTTVLEAELEEVGKLHDLHERMVEVRRTTEAADAAEVDPARRQLEDWVQQPLPFYDAFLLKAGLRIRKAFRDALTKS
jgi:hypothetical protein